MRSCPNVRARRRLRPIAGPESGDAVGLQYLYVAAQLDIKPWVLPCFVAEDDRPLVRTEARERCSESERAAPIVCGHARLELLDLGHSGPHQTSFVGRNAIFTFRPSGSGTG